MKLRSSSPPKCNPRWLNWLNQCRLTFHRGTAWTQQKGEWWETILAAYDVATQLFYTFLNRTSDSTCKFSVQR